MKDFSFALNGLDIRKKIFIAYSGGIDSTVLLHIFHSLSIERKLSLEAIHINHNLNDKSDDWAKHCKVECKKLGIPLKIVSTEINKDGGGLESAARKERYKIFSNFLKDSEQILTAHHKDDVTETIMLRLFRGTGIDGLAGLSEKRELANGFLIRPLLLLSKEQIKDHAKTYKLNFIEDCSNFKDEQDRNFIRNKLLPIIDTRWNEASTRISNASQITKSKLKIYNSLFRSRYHHLLSGDLNLKELRSHDKEIIKEIIRFRLKESNIAVPSQKVMNEILKTFIDSNPGPKSIVQWKRSDGDQVGGLIIYKNKSILIQEN